jgi:hypothetical protein
MSYRLRHDWATINQEFGPRGGFRRQLKCDRCGLVICSSSRNRNRVQACYPQQTIGWVVNPEQEAVMQRWRREADAWATIRAQVKAEGKPSGAFCALPALDDGLIRRAVYLRMRGA